MLIPSVEVIWQCRSPKLSLTMLRHFDQDERESDGSRHREAIKSVLLRRFERNGVQDFSDEVWLQKIFEGSSETGMEYCRNKDGILCYWRAIQGHSGCIPIEPEPMGYAFIPRNWKRYIFHRGLSWNLQSILGKGLFPGGKEKDKARHAVFPTPTNPSGDDPEEERPHDDFTVPHKAPNVTKWKYDQNALHWGAIVNGAGSRIGILADEVICNHHLRYNTWRLYWSCDVSKMENVLFSKGLKLQGRYLR